MSNSALPLSAGADFPAPAHPWGAMEHGVNVPLQLWGTTSPDGRESTGAQVRGAGSPEKASAYLASVEPQGHILVWVLSSGSKAPSSGWGGSAGGAGGQHGRLSCTPPTCGSESSLLAAL